MKTTDVNGEVCVATATIADEAGLPITGKYITEVLKVTPHCQVKATTFWRARQVPLILCRLADNLTAKAEAIEKELDLG